MVNLDPYDSANIKPDIAVNESADRSTGYTIATKFLQSDGLSDNQVESLFELLKLSASHKLPYYLDDKTGTRPHNDPCDHTASILQYGPDAWPLTMVQLSLQQLQMFVDKVLHPSIHDLIREC